MGGLLGGSCVLLISGVWHLTCVRFERQTPRSKYGRVHLDLEAAEKYVAQMFSGSKALLRPIYDELLQLGLKQGKDVKACPCQTMVPLYRNHVFAQLKPTTRTRIDLGFALQETKATGRLIDTSGYAKKDRITHRIPITSTADSDDEANHWLKAAYELDA